MGGTKMSYEETAYGLAYKDGYKAAEGIVPFGYKVNEP